MEATAQNTLEYELILMLDPETPDQDRDQIASSARERIESAGELKQERNWGMRRMAYEINKRGEADYRFFRFDGSSELLDDLNHTLRITDGVLRFRIFKVDSRMPVIDPPAPFTLEATAQRSGGRGGPRGRDGDRGPRESSAPSAPAPAQPATPAAEAPTETPAAAPAPAEASAETPAAAPAEEVAAEPGPAEAGPEASAPAAEPPPAAEPDTPTDDSAA